MQILCIYYRLHYLLSVHELALMEVNFMENRRRIPVRCYPNTTRTFYLIPTCVEFVLFLLLLKQSQISVAIGMHGMEAVGFNDSMVVQGFNF